MRNFFFVLPVSLSLLACGAPTQPADSELPVGQNNGAVTTVRLTPIGSSAVRRN